jgi:deoxyadenosine/deoxycytidine kinase
LNLLYDDWIRRYTIGKVLVVPADNLDFVHRKEDFEYVAGLVRDALPQMELFER